MAVVEGTPRRVKTLLLSFLQSSDAKQENSNQQTEVDSLPSSSTSMCQPRSKEAFWTRVETFSPFTWFAKPLELSPLHCALYGWENSDVDILHCVSCKASLDATMSADWDPEMFAKSCQQLKDSLVMGHSKLCPWPDNPCPEVFIQLPAYTPSQWKEDFLLRWQSLLSLGANLPSLESHVYKEMDEVSDNHFRGLEALLQSAGLMPNESTENLKRELQVSCLIGLCGWQKRNHEVRVEAEHSTLFCPMCRRELGVWNFRSINSSEEENQTTNQNRSVTTSTPSHQSRERSEYSNPSSPSKASEDDSESMDMGAQTGSTCSNTDDGDQYRGFAGCKRTNTGHRNVTSQRHDNPKSADIEECMDIEVKLKLHVPGQEDIETESEKKKQTAPFGNTPDQIMKSAETPMNEGEFIPREGTSATYKDSLLMKRFVTGRDSPLRGTESLPYRSPLHLSVSDLSEKEHCESLCVEVEEESLTEKLQSVESELEYMVGGSESSTEKDDYAPDIKRIRLEDLEKTKFHPISEHRSWCPWVTCGITGREKFSSSQESGNGWRMLLRTILPTYFTDRIQCFTDVPPKEAWIPVRRLLNECSSVPSKKNTPES